MNVKETLVYFPFFNKYIVSPLKCKHNNKKIKKGDNQSYDKQHRSQLRIDINNSVQ